ncbi:hypothetical protein [Alloprevotella sp. OH1205_COT-284]|uniref:hypothetical protein n=1 Tax=Alloprevotella sp. OH1205_COT-284 TaxID=2491043 RepID=UPI000F5E4F9F|nr:hypothetical protein [Alloprevotella sp. OH1205_COT-284]
MIFCLHFFEKGHFSRQQVKAGEGRREFCLHRKTNDFQTVEKTIERLPSLCLRTKHTKNQIDTHFSGSKTAKNKI